MGTDITMYAEVRENGKWNKVGEVFENGDYKPDMPAISWNKPYTDHPYDGRSYDLFAILADVRNGSGFAGIKTSNGFNPISEPKGIPEDVSEAVGGLLRDWYYGYSYLSLKELKEYDWNQTVTHVGVITEEQYIEMKESGEHPSHWCGSTSGKDIVTVGTDTMDKILNKTLDRNTDLKYYVQTEFPPVAYKECCPYFYEDTLTELEKLVPSGGTNEDVRIVFAFDS